MDKEPKPVKDGAAPITTIDSTPTPPDQENIAATDPVSGLVEELLDGLAGDEEE